MLVLLALPEIAQQAEAVGERRVRGDDCAGVAVSPEILARIETECGDVAETSGAPAVPARAVRLTRILDDEDAVPACELEDRLHRYDLTVEMHRHDRLRMRRQRALQERGIDQIVCVDVDEHRPRTRGGYRKRRRDIRVRGNDHFVAGSDAQNFQRELHRRRSRFNADAVFDADVPREVLFKSGDVGSEYEARVLHHLRYARKKLRAQRAELRL